MSKQFPPEKTFLELYINGEVLAEEIDDFVDKWHENPGKREIFEYLGMTKQEYAIWVRDPDVLPHIVRARRDKVGLPEVISQSVADMPIAARSSDQLKIKRLLQWLEQRGRVY